MPPADEPSTPELHQLVAEKLIRIFGAERGRGLLEEVLRELQLATVRTVDDLAQVAAALQKRGGFEATAGAMFSVQVAMRRMDRSA